MQITALAPALGADIAGVRLDDLDDDTFGILRRAWLDHGVVRIRDQSLDDDGLMRFSGRFGPLEQIPLGRLRGADRDRRLASLGLQNAYVTAISNIVEDGRPLGGLGHGEAAWHSDLTYIEDPPPASVLYAVEVPDRGGNTHFACQVRALAALPAELRARIGGRSIKHDAAHQSDGRLRPGHDAPPSPIEAPGAVHPIIRSNPDTGQEALFLGRRDWAWVVGLGLDESEALLDEVWNHATRPEHCVALRWRAGDVVIWDNRRVLHRRDAFPAHMRRMMRRCQVLAPRH